MADLDTTAPPVGIPDASRGADEALPAAWRRLAAAGAGSIAAPSGALLDRAELHREIALLAGGAERDTVYVAVFSFDRYTRLRSLFGEALAQQLAPQAAARLAKLEPRAKIGRLACELLALAFQAPTLRDAVEKAEAARCAVSGVYVLGDQRVDVAVSGGLSLGGPPAALIQEAELALEAARDANRPAAVFDAAAHANALQSVSLMPELRAAIASGALHLEHQPKLDLRARRLCGVESLVRWNHPRLGPLAPDLFVTMAEETGDIGALTEWVLDRALAEQAALAAAGARVDFAVNLSGRLIGDRGAVDSLLAQAATAQGPLTFEITETAIISRPETALANLERLSAAGHRVAIDDYGAGLSSLSYLKRMRAAELKLDRGLMRDITRGRRDALLVRSTIDLAHALDMKVVAEGVEDDATLALLVSMGCDVAQGWRIGRPQGYAALRALFTSPQASPAAEHRPAA